MKAYMKYLAVAIVAVCMVVPISASDAFSDTDADSSSTEPVAGIKLASPESILPGLSEVLVLEEIDISSAARFGGVAPGNGAPTEISGGYTVDGAETLSGGYAVKNGASEVDITVENGGALVIDGAFTVAAVSEGKNPSVHINVKEGGCFGYKVSDSLALGLNFADSETIDVGGNVTVNVTDASQGDLSGSASIAFEISNGSSVKIGSMPEFAVSETGTAAVSLSNTAKAITKLSLDASLKGAIDIDGEVCDISFEAEDLGFSMSVGGEGAGFKVSGNAALDFSRGNDRFHIGIESDISVTAGAEGAAYGSGTFSVSMTADGEFDLHSLPFFDDPVTADVSGFALDLSISGNSSSGDFKLSADVSADKCEIAIGTSANGTTVSLTGFSASASLTANIGSLADINLDKVDIKSPDVPSYSDLRPKSLEKYLYGVNGSHGMNVEDAGEVWEYLKNYEADAASYYFAVDASLGLAYEIPEILDEFLPKVTALAAAAGATDLSISASLDSLEINTTRSSKTTSSFSIDDVRLSMSSDGSEKSADISASLSIGGASNVKMIDGTAVKDAGASLSAEISGHADFEKVTKDGETRMNVTSYSYTVSADVSIYARMFIDGTYAAIEGDVSIRAAFSDKEASASAELKNMEMNTGSSRMYIRGLAASTDGSFSIDEAGCSGSFFGSRDDSATASLDLTVRDVRGSIGKSFSIGSTDAVIKTVSGGTLTMNCKGNDRTVSVSGGNVVLSELCLPIPVGDFISTKLLVLEDGSNVSFESDDGSLFVADNIFVSPDAKVSGSIAVDRCICVQSKAVFAHAGNKIHTNGIIGGYLGVTFGDEITYSLVPDAFHTSDGAKAFSSADFSYDEKNNAITLGNSDKIVIKAEFPSHKTFTVTVNGQEFKSDDKFSVKVSIDASDDGTVPMLLTDPYGNSQQLHKVGDAYVAEFKVYADTEMAVTYAAEEKLGSSETIEAGSDCIYFELGAGSSATVKMPEGVIYEVKNNGSAAITVVLLDSPTQYDGHDALHLWFNADEKLEVTVYVPASDSSSVIYHVNKYGYGQIIDSSFETVGDSTYLKVSPDDASYFYVDDDPLIRSEGDSGISTAVIAVSAAAIVLAAAGGCAFFYMKKKAAA